MKMKCKVFIRLFIIKYTVIYPLNLKYNLESYFIFVEQNLIFDIVQRNLF
jgi:hypothetical protein